MRKHTKIYFDYFGYGKEDFVSCEVCGRRACDVHHIDCRGMGGSKNKDVIENLMAVCRECHIKYGDKKEYMDFLKEKHHEFMEAYGKFY
jgi:5-methylcytosine-specific restriction endonuclease McrA